ncbi:GbsR/MarR family transcriptional regulator [Rubritalea tangerina]|uniref:HTH-type transcriptional regulator n=1 Tax=Rubritalea tangerina TaxID=430798 RepID=A0ABW4Z6Q4_9BACT
MSAAGNFKETKEAFIAQWGALGSSWGISRTMAQVHALLMVSPEPMSTDEVMDELVISRGNAHTNLKELVGWGLIRIVVKKGERKEFFEAEKDVWKMFTMVLKERQRREIDPALSLLQDCAENTEGETSAEGMAFHQQMKELEEFAQLASNAGDKISRLKYGPALKMAAKLLGVSK